MANLELENTHPVRLAKRFRQKPRWKIQRRLQEWRAGTEPVTIKTSSGKKSIAKRRIRAIRKNCKGCEVVLNSYQEIRRSKGILDEILKGMTRREFQLGRWQDDRDE